MRASRGEIKIADVLSEAGLTFQEEYSFQDLVSSSGRPLRFDFAVFDDNGNLDFLIEYQGIQHYEPLEIFGGEENFKIQQQRDMEKKKLFAENGVRLIEWKYDIIPNLSNLKNLLKSNIVD